MEINTYEYEGKIFRIETPEPFVPEVDYPVSRKDGDDDGKSDRD